MPRKSVAGTPADPTVHYAALEVDGKKYSLCFDFDAIATAEELTGVPLLVGVDWSQITARRLRAMLYASLLKAQPEITLAEVTGLIQVRNVGALESALAAAWMKSQPEADQNPHEPQQTAANL